MKIMSFREKWWVVGYLAWLIHIKYQIILTGSASIFDASIIIKYSIYPLLSLSWRSTRGDRNTLPYSDAITLISSGVNLQYPRY